MTAERRSEHPAIVADIAQGARLVMSRQAAGVTIITSLLNGEPVGMTATGVLSVSMTPPLLIASLTTTTRTAQGVSQTGIFAVHFLHDGQQALAEKFASPTADRFADTPYRPHERGGVPLLNVSLAHVLCVVRQTIELADHQLFVGAIEEATMPDEQAEPLLYFARSYRTLEIHQGRRALPAHWLSLLEDGGPLLDDGLPGWGMPL